MLGKVEGSRLGKALVAVSITEQQKDNMKQYDDDSAVVGSSLEAMDKALDDLSSDVRELGRCLKQTTFAASQLQKVQVKINSQIKNMLRREKVKMELKEKNILGLDRKLRKIERNQKKLIWGHKMYKMLRYVVILLIIGMVAYIYIGPLMASKKPEPSIPSPSAAVVTPTPSLSPLCLNSTLCTCMPK